MAARDTISLTKYTERKGGGGMSTHPVSRLAFSLTHMPRSVALFKKLGMQPIPAPTDYTVKESEHLSPGSFFPGAGNIVKVERAIHEYLGMIWAEFRGQI